MSLREPASRLPSDHTYAPPAPGDSRSPCPALNALANHGYLPHDGRGLTVPQLVHVLTQVYNLSIPLASVLSIVGILKCGKGWSMDLHDLAKHDVIEHDGSLVHADAPAGSQFAPVEVDPTLVKQLMSITPEDSLSLEDFAKARVKRDVAIRTPLDKLHAEIARGECALTVKVLGSDGVSDKLEQSDEAGSELRVSKAFIDQWFVQERLPDGWRKPSQTIGLFRVTMKSREVARMMHALRTSQGSS